MVDGEGGSSDRGWVKANVVRRGEGFEGVTTPAPRKILIIHITELSNVSRS